MFWNKLPAQPDRRGASLKKQSISEELFISNQLKMSGMCLESGIFGPPKPMMMALMTLMIMLMMLQM